MSDAPCAQPIYTISGPLSDRQARVLTLLINGLSHKQIAYEMGISVDCVREYLRRARVKCGVDNNLMMAFYLGRSMAELDLS